MTEAGASRAIGLAKVLLPVSALIMLTLLFFFARAPGGEGDVPYSRIEAAARDQSITAPRFAGVTPDGVSVTARAKRVTPGSDRTGFEHLSAQFEAPNGLQLSVIASEGLWEAESRRMTLTGLARVETSDGYRMETNALRADLAAGTVETDRPLEVRAPFGQLTAGTMSAHTADGQQRLVFRDGVHLLYDPQAVEGSSQ